MDGLGGVRITAQTSRRDMYEVYRLVTRIHQERQRAVSIGWFVLVLNGLLLVALASSADGVPAGLLVLLTGAVLIGVLSVSNRRWAWQAARRWSRTNPAGPWRLRVDGEGVMCAVGSRSTSYDWSAVAQVVEGEAAIVLAQAVTGRWLPFVSLPGAHLSSEDRASIRRWAEAAPGERPWTTVRRWHRVRRPRASSAPGPAPATSEAALRTEGLGGVRISLEPTRQDMYAVYRLVAKVYPPLRWWRALAWIVLLALSALMIALATRGGGIPIYVVSLAAIVAVYAVTFATERGWAWRSAGLVTRGQERPSMRIRVDSSGILASDAHVSSSYGWSDVHQVVEGNDALMFVLGTTRRSVMFVAVPAELSDEELASIRRWAEAAPGERTWTTYRRQRTFRRLRVAGSPAPG